MRQTFIVPLDGSKLAERALPYAVQLAAERDASLLLVQVATMPPTLGLEAGADWASAQEDLVDEARSYLGRVAASLAGRKIPVEWRVLFGFGRPVDAILGACDELHAAGVVMATHGRTGLPHLLYGSVAEDVLAQSATPVFLVCARTAADTSEAHAHASAARILVPLDGSSFAEAALAAARDIVRPAGEITLLRVVPPARHAERSEDGAIVAYLDELTGDARHEAGDYLRSVASRLAAQLPFASIHVDPRVGHPASEIVAAAAASRADLVVMATHGRTGLQRAVVGSVAGEVLRQGRTPVLLVHPTEAARAHRADRGVPALAR